MTLPPLQDDCLFCKIARKTIPSTIVYEDDVACVFKDVNPMAPVHLLIIPKGHVSSLADLKPDDREMLAHLFSIIPALAEKEGIAASGFRTVINSGAGAGQTVFHLHIHLMGGRSFRWPPG